VPPVASLHHHPTILKSNLILAAASSDSVKILLYPSEPIDDSGDSNGPYLLTDLQLYPGDKADLVTMTWTNNLASKSDNSASKASLLLATCARTSPSYISFFRVTLEIDGQNPGHIVVSHKTPLFQRTALLSSPRSISFSPVASHWHSEILVASESGTAYLYDPFSSRSPEGLKKATLPLKKDPERGSWITSFSTRFAPSTETAPSAYLAHRKLILDASFTSNGLAVVLLLHDGEWGVWDIEKGNYALWGMIGSGIPSHQSARKSLEPSNLPTMTPSTRKLKAEALFSGSVSPQLNAYSGGVTIVASGNTDMVTFWYNGTVCYIDDFQSYWARAVKRSAETKLQTIGGSLFGPGLARLDGLDLHGQTLTSVVQLPVPKGKASVRTVVIVTEHQVIYSTRGSPATAGVANSLLSHRPKTGPSHHHSRSLGQSMQLDIGTMDAILDSMDVEGDLTMSGALPTN
jgi:hypothetical protein